MARPLAERHHRVMIRHRETEIEHWPMVQSWHGDVNLIACPLKRAKPTEVHPIGDLFAALQRAYVRPDDVQDACARALRRQYNIAVFEEVCDALHVDGKASGVALLIGDLDAHAAFIAVA